MENPAKISLTKAEILIGSSKLPMVTALTANRDCSSYHKGTERRTCSTHQLIYQANYAMKIVFSGERIPGAPVHVDCPSMSRRTSFVEVGSIRTPENITYLRQREQGTVLEVPHHRSSKYYVP